jgi:hypothetical protein
MDVGSMTDTLEVPQRWIDAIVAKLAAKLALDTPEVDMQIAVALQAMAQDSTLKIWNDERDRSNLSIAANIGVYTR